MRNVLCLLTIGGAVCGQTPAPKPEWGPWTSLIGEWVAEDSAGAAGAAASGGFTFEFHLGGRIMVRKNFARYPATKERPGFRHDDLVVMYPEAAGTKRAVYWDNEGHVIEYATQVLEDGQVLRWVSAPSPGAPRFRFTHRRTTEKRLAVLFEIAPPGKPAAVTTYAEASVRRKE